jgi:hypothetical protein
MMPPYGINVKSLGAGNKVFLYAGYGAVADDAVRKRRASVKICLIFLVVRTYLLWRAGLNFMYQTSAEKS